MSVAAAPETDPFADMILFPDFEYDLRDSTTYKIQGERTPQGGCRWEETTNQTSETPILEGREIGVSPSTCLMVMEQGVPPRWTWTPTRKDDPVSTDAVAPSNIATSDGDCPIDPNVWDCDPNSIVPVPGVAYDGDAADAINDLRDVLDGDLLAEGWTRATNRTWWEDIINLTVNATTVSTTYHWNQQCVKQPVTQHFHPEWMDFTGWRKGANNWSHGAPCSGVWNEYTAHFYNNLFCPILFNDDGTHVDYAPTGISGGPYGNVTFSHNTGAYGGCAFLLHRRWVHCVEKKGMPERCEAYPPPG